MKRNALYVLVAVTVLASCRKNNDHVFDKSPDQRINETLGQYQSVITGATDGWNAMLRTGDGSYFRFWFRFDNNNRVVMYSDFSNETAGASRESSYRLKALQQPALIFDTYSYLHILSDPDAGANGGIYGRGRSSDFEFAIDTVTTDSINLSGRFNGSLMRLKKATAQDRAGWENKQVLNAMGSLRDLQKILQYWKKLTYNSVDYQIKIDTFWKRAQFAWTNGSQIQTVTRGYFFVPGGVIFSSPVVNGNTSITGMSINGYNSATFTMNVTINGTAATITGLDNTLITEPGSFNEWYQKALGVDAYWTTFNGFHVNGVDDALGIKTLKTDTSQFYYAIYWPRYGLDYDLFAPVYQNNIDGGLELYYGQALDPEDLNNGRTILHELGTLGTYPTTGPAATTRTRMRNLNGYYFIKTSPYTYDMISYSDAKSWLTWFWIF